jgi:Protein of unknown function (DUF3572)
MVKMATVSQTEAAMIAHQFIVFIGGNEQYLAQFLDQSGLLPKDFSSNMTDHTFLGFLLDFALQDESLLLAFAAAHDIAAESVVAARRALPGGHVDF